MELAQSNEKDEVPNRVAQTNLVDEGLVKSNSNSKSNEVVLLFVTFGIRNLCISNSET